MVRYRSLLNDLHATIVTIPKPTRHRRWANTGKLMPDTAQDTSPSSGNLRRWLILVCFLAATCLSCFVLLRVAYVARFRLPELMYTSGLRGIMPSFIADSDEYKLGRVLANAAMKDRTVILTTLNEAWAAPNSVIDLFLESFRIGNGTQWLLNHLVIVALDEKAFSRCLAVHIHCYALHTEGINFSKEAFFMTADYLKMMWRRIEFLTSVLEMGYNFVFTDADVMWFRNPFPRFYSDADFQIACDHYIGSSYDLRNYPNGGFNFVRSNNRSIKFYKFWYSARKIYLGYHDQDVLNHIKRHPYVFDLELRMRFLDTAYFGGFCEPSEDMNRVRTMHANCCVGLGNKLRDLRLVLDDWTRYLSLPPYFKRPPMSLWRAPRYCSIPHGSPQKSAEEVEEDVEDVEED